MVTRRSPARACPSSSRCCRGCCERWHGRGTHGRSRCGTHCAASRGSARAMTAATPVCLSPPRAVIGHGLRGDARGLRAQRSGLAPCAFETVTLETLHRRRCPGVDDGRCPRRAANASTAATTAWRSSRCRRTASPTRSRRRRTAGARARVGVFLGTSTSGILQTELAYRRRDAATGALPADFDYAGTQNTFSVAAFVRARLGLRGPGRGRLDRVLVERQGVRRRRARMIAAGLIDAAVVGGVDSLCLTTLYGFNSLQLALARALPALRRRARRHLDRRRRRPSRCSSAHRDALDATRCCCSASARAAMPTTCHRRIPRALGARAAMRGARATPASSRDDIDYINLHGTGTTSNDAPKAGPSRSRVRSRHVPAARPRARPAIRSARPARSKR